MVVVVVHGVFIAVIIVIVVVGTLPVEVSVSAMSLKNLASLMEQIGSHHDHHPLTQEQVFLGPCID